MRKSVLVGVFGVVIGCGSSSEAPNDAGGRADAGGPKDAAGHGDGGGRSDARGPTDAGGTTEAGRSSDAGGPSDTGAHDSGTTGDAGTSSDSGDSSVMHAEPPAPGATNPGDGTGSVTFAISKLYMGDTDRDGTLDLTNGWKSYGYDLDGKISTATSTDLCKPADGASPNNVYADGLDGIDNSFGKLVLPIFLGVAADFSSKINASIAGGKFTLMLDMQKLGTGADYNPLTTNLFGGGDLLATPKFDGTDQWPVLSSSLNDGATIASGSKFSFPTSYVTADTWVSGSKGNVELDLLFGSTVIPLTITNAVISLQLSPGHTTGTTGTIAGILNTAQFAAQVASFFGASDPSLCSGPTLASLTSAITQASDIMQDGTQDPTKTCDGISIGLGFDAAVVQLGAVVAPPAPQPNPCPDAG
jgi:hypothetical protein